MRIVGLLFLILLITSCTGQLPTVRQEVVREEVVVGEKEQPPILINRIATFNEMVSDLSANALIVYRDEDHTLSFRTDLIALNYLESIRVDLYDFVFKTPLVSIVKKDNDILAVNYIKKEYFSTTIDKMDFKRILGFEFPVELLLHSVLAKVYIPDQNYETKQVNDYSLEIVAPGRKQIITFNENLVPVDVQYTVQGNVYYVKFEKHDKEGSGNFPLRMTLRNKKRVLEVNYTNVDPDAELSEDIFLLEHTIPEGFTRVD